MACGCKDHSGAKARQKADAPRGDEHFIPPDGQCVLCADKHVSTAFAFSREDGYTETVEYRKRLVGELVQAQWHTHKEHPEFAQRLRSARHLIQTRRENEVDWHSILTELDALVSKDLEIETTNTKEA